MLRSKIVSYYQKIQQLAESRPWVFPVSLFLISLITYGVFISSLGFYWDDWSPVALSYVKDGSALWKFYLSDRPFQSWTYYVLFPICRQSTAAWQFSAIFFRFTSALALYYTFLRVFPKQKTLLQWSAILFVVYPGFSDLYASVSFGSHFLAYTVFGLSLLTMVLAMEKGKQSWIYFALSFIFTAVHLLTMEYFVGLEMLRPLLIFLILRQREPKTVKRLWKTLILWIPWLVILSVYVYWRMAIYPTWINGQHESNTPYLLINLIKEPAATLIAFGKTFFIDLKFMLLNAWSDRLIPDDLPIESMTFWFSVIIGVGVCVLFYYIIFSSERIKSFHIEKKEGWLNVGIGLYIILFGMFPVWSTLRQITEGKWSDRFCIAAMFGAVLIITTFIFSTFQNKKAGNVILICLAGLSIAYQIRVANDYRKDFSRQKAFYNQLAWRIPSLEPGTVIFSPTIPMSKESEYSLTAGVDILFEPGEIDETFNYWFLTPRHLDVESVLKNPAQILEEEARTYTFTGSTDKIVSINMPASGCLWVINPYYALAYTTDGMFPNYAKLSNESLIHDVENPEGSNMDRIFDTGAQNTWCYYFQKGDLAQSKGDWEKAISYYEQAITQGLKPLEGIEYLPFIQSYTQLGQIEKAVELTQKTIEKTASTRAMFCQFWSDRLAGNAQISQNQVSSVYNAEDCPAFFE